jgi:hypothetical protein
VTAARSQSLPFSRRLSAAFAALRRRTSESLRVGPRLLTSARERFMDSYEFAYFGRDIHSLENAIASWCSERKCQLETTELEEGATFRISGPDATVREAMQMVRVWMLRTR